MSTSIYWRPTPTNKERLSHAMKGALRELINDNRPDTLTFDESLIPYLRGVQYAGSEEVWRDAKALLDAIYKYGSVQVWLE